MRCWSFGGALVVLASVAVPAARQPAECPAGRPTVLTASLAPVFGKSPIWVTHGRGPLAWAGADQPLTMLWVRDLSVSGIALVSAKHRDTGEAARFGRRGSTAGLRAEQFKLDPIGGKPKTATAADFKKFTFDEGEVWFPSPGCYEVSARVGRQQATFYLNVESRK